MGLKFILAILAAGFSLTSAAFREGYIRGGHDPFLQSSCPKGSNFTIDSLLCDRAIICPKKYTPYVLYCPKGHIFGPQNDGTCVPISDGFCPTEKRKQTVRKPSRSCPFKRNFEYYLEMDGAFKTYTHAMYQCKPGFDHAHVIECVHAEKPKIIMEIAHNVKCVAANVFFEHGQIVRKRTKAAEVEPKVPKIVQFRSLPIRFLANNKPICPANDVVNKRIGFTISSRFRHNEDCVHFWTCDLAKNPTKHSCPHTQVFDPNTEKCVFYKYAKAPCNKVFDHVDKVTLTINENVYNRRIADEAKAKARENSDYAIEELKELLRQEKILRKGSLEYRENLREIGKIRQALRDNDERERTRAALTKKLVRSKRDAPVESEILVVTEAPKISPEAAKISPEAPKISHEAIIQESLKTSMMVEDYIAGILNDFEEYEYSLTRSQMADIQYQYHYQDYDFDENINYSDLIPADTQTEEIEDDS